MPIDRCRPDIYIYIYIYGIIRGPREIKDEQPLNFVLTNNHRVIGTLSTVAGAPTLNRSISIVLFEIPRLRSFLPEVPQANQQTKNAIKLKNPNI